VYYSPCDMAVYVTATETDMNRADRPDGLFEFRQAYITREKNMRSLALRLAILTVGISLAVYLVPGMEATGYGSIIEAAILLGVLNLIIKPLLFILTLPINILSLGLFTFIINGLMLLIVSAFVGGLEIRGFGAAILGSIVISIFSIVAGRLVR